ncbi:hypothetical protein T10_11920 [Trichinella papuae]|uniref:Uncharacterized protein n=1 Tax=Trichinella papuae TaxID=268474 RepID=A0A0V1M6M3_9BILA|nr:hypothetical protein T10_11920 [Trichinella papuae]
MPYFSTLLSSVLNNGLERDHREKNPKEIYKSARIVQLGLKTSNTAVGDMYGCGKMMYCFAFNLRCLRSKLD